MVQMSFYDTQLKHAEAFVSTVTTLSYSWVKGCQWNVWTCMRPVMILRPKWKNGEARGEKKLDKRGRQKECAHNEIGPTPTAKI